MRDNALQVEYVVAGRAILWSRASLFGGVAPAHPMPVENETVSIQPFPATRGITGQAGMVVQSVSRGIGVTLTGYVAGELAYAGTSLPLLAMPHHSFGQSWIGGGAATGIALSTKSALETCTELLNARRGRLRPEQFQALARQLNALLSDEDELVASRIDVSAVSLDGLIEFIVHHQPARHPNIAITRDGRFSASWMQSRQTKITLTFDANRIGGDWVGVDLGANPPALHRGAFLVDSLSGIAQPFRTWIKA